MRESWVEVERRDANEAGIFGEDFPCRGCGRPLRLWFNGGELDEKECCGFKYALEHVRVDFVISRRAEGG